MPKLFIDLETFSETPISYGVHKYSEKVEILLIAWALDDSLVQVIDLASGESPSEEFNQVFYNPEVQLIAHNSTFDRTVLNACGMATETTRWYDTMVQAYTHSLPGSLDTLSTIYGLPENLAKMKEGRQLMLMFCKPLGKNRTLDRATSKSHPREWAVFKQYAAQDVEAMREIHRKMPTWNFQGKELELWHLDQKINDKGFLVDTKLANEMIRAVNADKEDARDEVKESTLVVDSATKTAALLKFILEAFGVQLPNMQKSTLEKRLNDPNLPDAVKDLINLRLRSSKSSTSKYQALIDGVSSDGRLRGTLQFCGATMTGRWAGRHFQPQNLPRPSLKAQEINVGIEAVKRRAEDIVVPDVMELASNAIRGCIIAPRGRKLVVVDYSGIEGRMLAWLAGAEWKIKAYEEYDKGRGVDAYVKAYSEAFKVPENEVNDAQRQIGKVLELMLGYEGGVGAFVTGAATYRVDLDSLADKIYGSLDPAVLSEAYLLLEFIKSKKGNTYGLSDKTWAVCDSLKRMWRNSNPEIVKFWADVSTACKKAIGYQGTQYRVGEVRFLRTKAWLLIKLPSGRCLCFPGAHVSDGNLTYNAMSHYTNRWQKTNTYAGKIVNRITQAASRDLMAEAMPRAEAAGYEVLLTVHDELICETPDTLGYSSTELGNIMTTGIDWAKRLPLAVKAFETYRYRKD